MKRNIEFRLRFGKRWHELKRFLTEANEYTELPEKAEKVETTEGDIFPIGYVKEYRP